MATIHFMNIFVKGRVRKCHKMYHFNIVAIEREGKSEIREKELSQCKYEDEQIPKLSKR